MVLKDSGQRDTLSLDSICNVKVYQRKEGYRFSIDSVLLARFINVRRGDLMLAEFGAGCGVVGLIVAKRFQWTVVHMYEIQQGLFELCKKNIEINDLSSRVRVYHRDVRSLGGELAGKYDVIFSNPPYRAVGSGRMSPYSERAIARHELTITMPELIQSVSRMLNNRGRFFVIYNARRLSELMIQLKQNSLEPKRLRIVYPFSGAEATMVLVEAVKNAAAEIRVDPPLFIYTPAGEYSEEVASYLNQ